MKLIVSILLFGIFTACKSSETLSSSTEETTAKEISEEKTPSEKSESSSSKKINNSTESSKNDDSSPNSSAKISSAKEASSNSENTLSSSKEEVKETPKFTPLSGSFTQTDVKVTGNYTIEEMNGKLQIRLSDDFYSDPGPDLYIILTKRSFTSVGTYNFKSIPKDDILQLSGKLSSFAGITKELPITKEELKAYQTVLIQCVKYSHLYGKAKIEHP